MLLNIFSKLIEFHYSLIFLVFKYNNMNLMISNNYIVLFNRILGTELNLYNIRFILSYKILSILFKIKRNR